MAAATRKLGYGYFGIADHSQSAGYAGGLKPDRVSAQWELADDLNRRSRGRFQIFKGIESDILEDGSLDYPDEILSGFDYVVASIHSRFKLDPSRQTERMIRAVANPHTTILGHLTGRLLLRREGYELDIDAVLRACADHGVAVEINANPHRLDLDWRWYRRALELGCWLSINPDAHSVDELGLTRWGVLVARKGGVPRERVLNCLDRAELGAWLAARKERARRAISAPGGGAASTEADDLQLARGDPSEIFEAAAGHPARCTDPIAGLIRPTQATDQGRPMLARRMPPGSAAPSSPAQATNWSGRTRTRPAS
jgi:DNA polymerase (family 10)